MTRGVAMIAAVVLCAATLVGCPAGGAQPDLFPTLGSLRQVDDHPLWTMTLHGGYDRLKEVAPPPTPVPFGCRISGPC